MNEKYWKVALRDRDRGKLESALGGGIFNAPDLQYFGPSSQLEDRYLCVFMTLAPAEGPNISTLRNDAIEVRLWSPVELASAIDPGEAERPMAEVEPTWFSIKGQTAGKKYALLSAQGAPGVRDPKDDVGKGDRFANPFGWPRGHGFVNRFEQPGVLANRTWLNADAVGGVLSRLAKHYPLATRFNHLPELTEEKKEVYILRVGKRIEKNVPAVALVAGAWADDWLATQALVGFVRDFLAAVHTPCGLGYYDGLAPNAGFPQPVFAKERLLAIFERLNLLIVPLVNPDGRDYGLSRQFDWRKNRTKTNPKEGEFGVLIDANTDFLWDYEKKLGGNESPSASRQADTWDYGGPFSFSEPETRNIRHLLSDSPEINWFVHVLVGRGGIRHAPTFAPIQTSNPQMNFTNPEFDRMRGRLKGNGKYAEYMPEPQLHEAHRLSLALRSGSGSALWQDRYHETPCPGGLCDYAYSVSSTRPADKPIYAFEFSAEGESQGLIYEASMCDVAGGVLRLCEAIIDGAPTK